VNKSTPQTISHFWAFLPIFEQGLVCQTSIIALFAQSYASSQPTSFSFRRERREETMEIFEVGVNT
jgi:hypothetical protein